MKRDAAEILKEALARERCRRFHGQKCGSVSSSGRGVVLSDDFA
jgi:hypothetical protein